MIVKKVRREIVDKPKTWQIGDLVDYIRLPHNKNPQEKVAHAGSRNFLTSTHNGQKMEMIALAEESVHSKMPVQHWIFSWQEGEQPTREQADEAAHARERKLQEAMLGIKKRYGKNAILKGMNLEDGATAKERNQTIGGHQA